MLSNWKSRYGTEMYFLKFLTIDQYKKLFEKFSHQDHMASSKEEQSSFSKVEKLI